MRKEMMYTLECQMEYPISAVLFWTLERMEEILIGGNKDQSYDYLRVPEFVKIYQAHYETQGTRAQTGSKNTSVNSYKHKGALEIFTKDYSYYGRKSIHA